MRAPRARGRRHVPCPVDRAPSTPSEHAHGERHLTVVAGLAEERQRPLPATASRSCSRARRRLRGRGCRRRSDQSDDFLPDLHNLDSEAVGAALEQQAAHLNPPGHSTSFCACSPERVSRASPTPSAAALAWPFRCAASLNRRRTREAASGQARQLSSSTTALGSRGARSWGEVRGFSGRLRVLRRRGAEGAETGRFAGMAN